MDPVELTVLSVSDCPNARTALDRCFEAARISGDVVVHSERIDTDQQAQRLGMHGSPTITIGGIDPFSEPGTQAHLACRFGGGVDPVPPVVTIVAAIGDRRTR
jgi:hypothetical protein